MAIRPIYHDGCIWDPYFEERRGYIWVIDRTIGKSDAGLVSYIHETDETLQHLFIHFWEGGIEFTLMKKG